MVDPRMRVAGGGLQELDNPINVHGLNNMDMNRPEERTRLDTNPIDPQTERSRDLTHLRRFHPVPMSQDSVNSFIHKYCFILDNEENCLWFGQSQKEVMGEMFVRQFVPWIRNHLVYHLDESQWPLEMDLFETLNDLLPDKFPEIHSSSRWRAITQCYRRLQRLQGWVEADEDEIAIDRIIADEWKLVNS